MEFKNYYKILGITSSADDDAVKKAYRSAAKKWHPDKNQGNPKAEEKFKQIAEAYEVLSDPDKRKKLDDFISGATNRKRYTPPTGNRPSGYARPSGSQSQYKSTNTDEGDYSDFFKQFFKQRKKGPYTFLKGDDVRGNITIGLEEAYLGSTRILNLESGKIRIQIKPGVRTDKILKINEKGKSSKLNGRPGDLYIRIIVQEHSIFTRKKHDLYREIDIDIYTAIAGGEFKLSTFKGDVSLKIPAGVESGKVLRLKDYGMPVYDKEGRFGDLFLTIRYKMPTHIGFREKELLEELKKIREGKVN